MARTKGIPQRRDRRRMHQKTWVGGRKGTMKKTTARGAYNKGRKNVMMRRRAPFVETKSKTTEDIAQQFGLVDHIVPQSFNTPTAHINPEVFTVWKQGLGETEHIGQSVFAKYLKRKLVVTFPQPNVTMSSGNPGVIPKIPQRYEVIWGFIPAPLNHTGSTTPAAYNTTVSDINGYINERVKDYLDEEKDYTDIDFENFDNDEE